MKVRMAFLMAPAAITAIVVAAPVARCAPAVTTSPVAPASGAIHHYRHYGHFRHYGHYGYYGHYGHYRHYGRGFTNGIASAPGDSAGADSFIKDGRRYYWYMRGGHRVYSSHPPAGYAPAYAPTPGALEDLDTPLSRTERAEQAARQQKAQAHLAALERRVARQRHQERLKAKALRQPGKRR